MLLRTLVPAATATVLLAASAQAAPVTTTYTDVGESVFVVPPGVHSVDVALTGAGGGSGTGGAPGGLGATVSGTLGVFSGMRLYANVGGAGADSPDSGPSAGNAGGYNGGGAGTGGGGGASDIRMMPAGSGPPLSS